MYWNMSLHASDQNSLPQLTTNRLQLYAEINFFPTRLGILSPNFGCSLNFSVNVYFLISQFLIALNYFINILLWKTWIVLPYLKKYLPGSSLMNLLYLKYESFDQSHSCTWMDNLQKWWNYLHGGRHSRVLFICHVYSSTSLGLPWMD